MKNKRILIKDLINCESPIKNSLPFSFDKIFLTEIEKDIKPAYMLKGRKFERLQNENFLIKGNGLRIPISKFKLT